jgi:hypothetical protein
LIDNLKIGVAWFFTIRTRRYSPKTTKADKNHHRQSPSQISKDLPRLKSTFARASRPRRNRNLDVAHNLKPLRARVHSSTGTHEALNTTVFVKEENGGFGVEILYLAQEEVDGCGFTCTRLTDDHGVGNAI